MNRINCQGHPYFKEKWFDNIKDNFLNIKTYNPEKCDELEELFCKKFNMKYAATVNSGTTGIWSSLVACGITKDDEVIIPNYGFPAAFNCVQSLAKPVLVDLNRYTLAMDLEAIQNAITPKTKVLIHIETNGWVSDAIEDIQNICKENNIVFIEDSCPSYGQTYNGQLAGTFGDLSIFSFSLHKNLYCGEGGIVLTNNKEYYDQLLSIRYNDKYPEYKNNHNHNICFSSVLANLIIEQINDENYCELLFNEKERIHNEYKKYLDIYDNEKVSNYYIFSTFFPDNPDKLETGLKRFFDIDLRSKPYPVINKKLPVSNWIANHHFDLPCYIGLSNLKIKTICNYIKSIS